ncbi:MAG: hypothetical protein ACYS47_00055 [Planctomycetota bacterium]|jgi:hypothetical protein
MQKQGVFRVVLGALVWGAIAAGLVALTHHVNHRAELPSYPAREVWTYLTTAPRRARIDFPAETAANRGDPVCRRIDGNVRTVGQIRLVSKDPEKTSVIVEFYEGIDVLLTKETRFYAIPNPNTPAWIIDVLLPPDRKNALLQDLRTFAAEHQEDIFQTFWPPFEAFLRDAFQILGDELPQILENRDTEVQEILDRHKEATFRKELLPILREEFWPLIREKSAPLMEEVGQELWEQLPLYQLGWRYFYKQIPFTDKEILRRRWNKYLDQEAIPVLEGRTDDFLEVIRQVMLELSSNPKLSIALKNCLAALVEDPEFVQLVAGVFTDLVAPRGKIFVAFEKHFSDPKFLDGLNHLMEALGPTLNRISNRILLDEDGKGINPDLAQVLRTQVLWKDECWILVEPTDGLPARDGDVFQGKVYSWKGPKARR